MERTLIIVKPDGVQRGLTGEIIRRFEQRAAARVEILVDVSASMRFGIGSSHYELALELVSAMARAASTSIKASFRPPMRAAR